MGQVIADMPENAERWLFTSSDELGVSEIIEITSAVSRNIEDQIILSKIGSGAINKELIVKLNDGRYTLGKMVLGAA